jgi:hypothetical protein
MLGKLGVREREKMIELPCLEAADAKIHECPPLRECREQDG